MRARRRPPARLRGAVRRRRRRGARRRRRRRPGRARHRHDQGRRRAPAPSWRRPTGRRSSPCRRRRRSAPTSCAGPTPSGAEGTDDAALVERARRTGRHRARRAVEPQDHRAGRPRLGPSLARRERRTRDALQVRVGQGFDVHRTRRRPGPPAGARRRAGFPSVPGLVGHSDGDAVAHAVAEALLGAAGLGDIGQHFPDTDPTLAGADSIELLRQVAADVVGRAAGRSATPTAR